MRALRLLPAFLLVLLTGLTGAAGGDELWGWASDAGGTVEGEVLVRRLSDGRREELRGIVVDEDDTYVWIRQRGDLKNVRRSKIVERRKEDLDPREVWSADQLWEKYLAARSEAGAKVGAMDTHEHFLAGEFAEWIDELERARGHFAVAADDEAYVRSGLARTRLERVEALIGDRAARAGLRKMREWLGRRQFLRVCVAIAGFAERHPEVSEATRAVLERLEIRFERVRNAGLRLLARKQFPGIAETLIEKKVAEAGVTLLDVTAWARRDLPEDAFVALAAAMRLCDDVTPEEAQSFWEQRRKQKWLVRSYDSGTFIVRPFEVRDTTPRPPTRDQWWAGATTPERKSWVMAYFAERSGLFEVRSDPPLRGAVRFR